MFIHCNPEIFKHTGWQSITEILYRAISERIKAAGIIPQLPKSSLIWYICVSTPGRLIFHIMAEPEELFTKAQKSEIILQYSKLGSATSVRRWSRNHYPNFQNCRIPSVRTFSSLILRKHRKRENFWSHRWNIDRGKHWEDLSNDCNWLSLIFMPL